MSERTDLVCGCAYIRAGGKWYQVVACPDHVMDMRPHDDVPDNEGGTAVNLPRIGR